MVDDDDGAPLTAEQRRQEAIAAASIPLDSRTRAVDIETVPGEAHITDKDRWCPNPVPCIGRPAVGIAVPVRLTSTRETVGEVTGVYCPSCRSMSADQTPTDARA